MKAGTRRLLALVAFAWSAASPGWASPQHQHQGTPSGAEPKEAVEIRASTASSSPKRCRWGASSG
jgi:hypothetical protein